MHKETLAKKSTNFLLYKRKFDKERNIKKIDKPYCMPVKQVSTCFSVITALLIS